MSSLGRKCPNLASRDFPNSAPFRKYSIETGSVLAENFTSWTDAKNVTHIFESPPFEDQKLKSILLHEILISIDPKSNWQAIGSSQYPNFYREIDFSKPSPVNESTEILERSLIQKIEIGSPIESRDSALKIERFQRLMELSKYLPFQLTFSALRAFDGESFERTGRPQVLSAEGCRNKFLQIFEQIQGSAYGAQTGDGSELSLQKFFSREVEELIQKYGSLDRVLEILLRSHSPVPLRQGQSFCQFMSTSSLLQGRHADDSAIFFGPRPRVTGGSDSASGAEADEPSRWDKLGNAGSFQNNQNRKPEIGAGPLPSAPALPNAGEKSRGINPVNFPSGASERRSP